MSLEGFSDYSDFLMRFYEAIGRVSENRFIVDSSKVPSYAYVLANLPGVDLYIVHLIRDSRAVAYSWLKRKVKHELRDEVTYMDRHKAVSSSLGWMRTHLLTEPLKYTVPHRRYLKVRYEDFIEDPVQTLARIMDVLGEDDAKFSFMDDGKISLGECHTIEGNPMRFESGDVKLRLDDEWKRTMRLSNRRTVTAITWPLLAHYGYEIKSS